MKKVKRFVNGDFTLGTLASDNRQIIIDKDGKPIITSNDESSK